MVRLRFAAPAAFLTLRLAATFCFSLVIAYSVPFEVLNSALVSLGLFPRWERSKIATLSRFGVFLARVEPVLSRFQFANHGMCDAIVLSRCAELSFEETLGTRSEFAWTSAERLPQLAGASWERQAPNVKVCRALKHCISGI